MELTNCDKINKCHVFIGQYDQNDKNTIFSGRCAPPSPRYKHVSCKHTLTKESDWFHKHPTKHSFLIHIINYGKARATTSSIRFWLIPSQLSTAKQCDVWGSVYDIRKFYIRVPDGNTVKAEREYRKSVHTLPKKEQWELLGNHTIEFPIVWVSCFDMVGCFQLSLRTQTYFRSSLLICVRRLIIYLHEKSLHVAFRLPLPFCSCRV